MESFALPSQPSANEDNGIDCSAWIVSSGEIVIVRFGMDAWELGESERWWC